MSMVKNSNIILTVLVCTFATGVIANAIWPGARDTGIKEETKPELYSICVDFPACKKRDPLSYLI